MKAVIPLEPALGSVLAYTMKVLAMGALVIPHLATVQHVVIALLHCSRRHTDHVRARSGFRHGKTAHLLTRDEVWQILGLLLLGAVPVELVHAEVAVGTVRQSDRARCARKFLHNNRVVQVSFAETAEFFGHRDAEQTHVAELEGCRHAPACHAGAEAGRSQRSATQRRSYSAKSRERHFEEEEEEETRRGVDGRGEKNSRSSLGSASMKGRSVFLRRRGGGGRSVAARQKGPAKAARSTVAAGQIRVNSRPFPTTGSSLDGPTFRI
ncbi:hypothetical protein L1887_53698 [Cichorium endivia]|nr:hypothetical protein L1887_53698 [Cichorium endivia]